MKVGDYAVCTLMGGVLVYDILTRPGETISEAVDRYLERHPIVTTTFIVITAGHLLNRLPAYLDFYALFFKGAARVWRRQYAQLD